MTQLQKISEFAKKIHSADKSGHDFAHITRVVALAKKIVNTIPEADENLVLATCYLHDTYDAKLTENVLKQKQEVKAFLTSIDFQKIDELFYIIDNMSFSANLLKQKKLDINGQIVQDADRLDAMGAWGIVRTLEYSWAKNRKIYDPTIQPTTYQNKEEYHTEESTAINHFYEKLFLLKDLLNTEEGKKIGAKKDQLMHDFVEAIIEEY
ncbi:MAG: HD domain-containing protein [Streptococcaceae bacterium]|jgi:uncharacterized protein|nr:HD domain-containing protein [Streptococcaceae bacterium]